MRRLWALLLAAVLCLSLCACGGTVDPAPEDSQPEASAAPSEEPKTLTLAYDPAASRNPITGESRVNQVLTSLIYEGLYVLDEAFQPQPVLASGAEVDETGLIWTITLAPGTRFSDGTPLTAEHVVRSLNLARTSTLYGARLNQVSSIRAAEGQVVITLTTPNGVLPALLDVPVILEQEDGVPLGTGRYRYAGEGEDLYLLANYNREGTVPYASIALYPVTGADQRIAAFDSGAVSVAVTDFSSPYSLGYSASCEVWDYATTDLLYVGFNAAKGPCASALVRQALSRAFDRETLVADLLAGHGDPSALPVHPASGDWSAEAAALLDYDLTAAAELLARAGYTYQEEDGLLYLKKAPLELTLVVNSDNLTKCAMADRLAEAMESLGITVTVKRLTWNNYLTALSKGEFDLYLGEVQLPGDFDPAQLLSGGLNYGQYNASALTEALGFWRNSAGALRQFNAGTLWTLFAQEAPVAPLCFKRESLLVRWGTVSGWDPVRGDLFRGMENWIP